MKETMVKEIAHAFLNQITSMEVSFAAYLIYLKYQSSEKRQIHIRNSRRLLKCNSAPKGTSYETMRLNTNGIAEEPEENSTGKGFDEQAGLPSQGSERKGEKMIRETITQIEARIQNAKSLSGPKKKELLDLLSTLKTEVSKFSKTHPEQTQSITGFTEVSIHEATREEKNPQLLKLSLQGLSTSVKGFEGSHPKLVGIVNSICLTLSNIGI
jgi:hypothetical protein